MFNAQLGLVLVFGLITMASLSVGFATALGYLGNRQIAKAIKANNDTNRVG